MAGTRKQKKSSKVVDLDSRRGAVRSSQIRKHATMGAPLPTSEDAETAAGGESAKIYGFSYVRRRGKRAEDVAPEPERMNSQVVIEALERELNAMMPQELRDLLELPANLRRSESGLSFSTETDGTLGELAQALALRERIPPRVPEYGISLGRRGGSVFCTLVDSRRKIIVREEVSSTSDFQGQWRDFLNSMREALAEVAKNTAEKRDFRFVYRSDFVTRTV